MNDLWELWELIEGKLSSLLANSSPPLEKAALSEMQHYIDHREYGLALEEYVGAIETSGAVVSDDTLRAVGELARLMKMDEKSLTDNLRSS